MELTNSGTEAEPISYDVSTLPEGHKPDAHVYPYFWVNRTTFGDELQDAVAINRGIDKNGVLDMAMLAGLEAVESYVEGRSGQPIVVAELHYKDPERTKLWRIEALAGVLDDSDKLVGVVRDEKGFGAGGIMLQAETYAVAGCDFYGSFRLENSIPQTFENDSVMPIDMLHFRLGRPGYGGRSEPETYFQDVVAGEDILPWLTSRFGEGIGAYSMFCGFLNAFKTAEAQEYILKEPFTSMLTAEQKMLHDIRATLETSRTKIDRLLRAADGEKALASLRLSEIYDEAGALASLIPHTLSSERTHVTAEVSDITDIDRRLSTIKRNAEELGRLVIKPF
jgi:hypothetical protein